MNQLKPHPLEAEVDRVITDLQGSLHEMKEAFDSGTIYRFNFDKIPVYISLPTYVSSRSDNLIRIECKIGVVDAKDVGRILFAIALDFDTSRHHPIRVVPRTKDQKVFTILLQFVCALDLMQTGFIAQTILYSADLAGFYRDEFLVQNKTA